jgi:hypothetical protein
MAFAYVALVKEGEDRRIRDHEEDAEDEEGHSTSGGGSAGGDQRKRQPPRKRIRGYHHFEERKAIAFRVSPEEEAQELVFITEAKQRHGLLRNRNSTHSISSEYTDTAMIERMYIGAVDFMYREKYDITREDALYVFSNMYNRLDVLASTNEINKWRSVRKKWFLVHMAIKHMIRRMYNMRVSDTPEVASVTATPLPLSDLPPNPFAPNADLDSSTSSTATTSTTDNSINGPSNTSVEY